MRESLEHLSPKSISSLLQEGIEIRNILASLLNLNYTPNLYTYGNPDSYDAIVAQKIAKETGIAHRIYNWKLDSTIFKEKAKKIIINGNTQTSIHRVHRLMSVEEEAKSSDLMILGTLGGEFIKGVGINDYIIPKFAKLWWQHEKDYGKVLIKDTLTCRYYRANEIDINKVEEILSVQPFFSNTQLKNEFYILGLLTARMHDAQDINIYSKELDVLTPFLDIDYLNILFKSRYTFLNKAVIKNKIQRRMENPLFSSNFLKFIYKPLLNIEYAGFYSPKEVLISKYYAASLKYVRQRIIKRNYPSNFPLKEWMFSFILENYESALYDPQIGSLFISGDYVSGLSISRNSTVESQWIPFTNPIMFKFVKNQFIE